MPFSSIYSVSSSAMRLVSVVTNVRKPRFLTSCTSASTSSTWLATGRISTGGSVNPVGRITCSTKTPSVRSNSHLAGVAETNTVWGRFCSHSSNLSGRLSMPMADGSHIPPRLICARDHHYTWHRFAAPSRGFHRQITAHSPANIETGSVVAAGLSAVK